jgi:hypothetical protein
MIDPFDDDWRELGFYCHHDSKGREYRLIGSRAGLMKFVELLRAYVADPHNAAQGEHEHYGPYGLEVMTWPDPGIDDHAIQGPLPKLAELASLIEEHLAVSIPGQQVRIREEFAPSATFALVLDMRHDGFDPPHAADEIFGPAG